MEIAGKVFIVTGGASGLGEGTARMLTAKGGKVVIADMQAEKGEAIARELGGAFVKCDVSNEADGQAVVTQAVSMGKLMGLVNCAGIAPAEKTVGKNGAHALASFSKTITVNVIGSFNRIRLAAEAEEREFYERRAPEEWLDALAPLGTDADKPFLEIAPWLIAVFYERTGPEVDGHKAKRYYPHESTGIACGMLIAALHQAGLATLTHTPSPMAFLNELLERPRNEVPYLLLVVGHPAPGCRVPDIQRKPLDAIASFR